MKVCKGCLKSLPLSSFYARKTGIPYTLCRVCYLADKKARDAARKHQEIASKVCTSCWTDLPIDNFHKNRGGAGGKAAICKTCAYIANLATKYKIYNIAELIEERSGLCDICKEPFNKKPHVDHDHDCCSGDYTCGECFRGLLCYGCNVAIGFMRDNPQSLRAAAEYLEKAK